MRINLPLPELVRVVNASNYKGNPRAVLLLGDTPVLYLDRHVEDEELSSQFFQLALARMFRDYLLETSLPAGDAQGWSPKTDREISTGQYDTLYLHREGEEL